MECAKCRTENPEQAKFCIDCGSKIEFHCPGCGAVTPATGKFCMECGNNLKEAEPQSPVNYRQPQSYTPKHLADKILSHRSAIEGERKLVTVLFADVAGWAYFFIETPEYDAKALRKFVAKGDTPAALTQLRERLADVDFADLAALETAVHAVEAACEIREGKLNQPVRVAVTGCGVGAGVYETMTILGRDRCLQRLDHALALCASADN